MENLSLVVFTVLGQGAAGMAFVLALQGLSRKEPPGGRLTVSYSVMIVLLGIAGMASLLHLGQPFRAINVLGGLAHGSPLSWEIVSVALFGAIAALVSMLHIRRHPLANNRVLPVTTAIAGLVMVSTMSRVYNLHTVDPWFSIWTPVQFMMTSLVLGFALVITLDAMHSTVTRWMRVGVTVSALLTFMSIPLFVLFLGSLPGMTTMLADNGLTIARCALLAVGALLLGMPLMNRKYIPACSIAGVACLVASELAGRVMFYDLLAFRIL